VFDQLAANPASGVAVREGLELLRAAHPEDPWWSSAVRSFRRARREQLPAWAADGWAFEAPVVDMGRYLPFLRGRLDQLGARLHTQALSTLDQAPGDLVVNCSGLGAHQLVPDPTLTPIRGQVVRVANPGLERFVIADHHPGGMAYVIPRFQDVICGGTSEEGASSLHPDEATTRAILHRCADLEPALASARVLEVKVGLRPGRPAIRLDTERRGGRTVIHDYGHGGAGVTVSWGCAEAVVGLCIASWHADR
jgi:D-amino-acid oxidase